MEAEVREDKPMSVTGINSTKGKTLAPLGGRTNVIGDQAQLG